MAFQSKEVKVIIIGGGVGGLSTGIALKRQLNFHNFQIYEQSNDVSGTWHANTYPGCASDIDTHWYSLSTDLNPYWRKSHVSQAELKEYWKQLAVKYSLYDQLLLNRQVTSVEWNNKGQFYRVESIDLNTKEVSVEEAQVVISAAGILYVPYHPPELTSVKTFKGPTFHSARWDHSINLHNKRVAVIGNGCSASQFVPIITQDRTTQVVNFCRTPHWYLKWHTDTFSETQKWIFAHIPFAMRLYRNWIMVRQEYFYVGIISGEENALRVKMGKQLEEYIKNKAPPEYHDRVIPNYPLGCKRFIVDSGYLSALHQPNFDINYDGITEFTENGIVTKKGENIPFDVVVFATGFVVDKYPVKVRGVEGITVQEYYDKKGGPEAYLGVTVPGFPNFYLLGGPNTATGHGSVIFTEEVQIDYILKFVKPVIQGLAASFEVTSQANDSYNIEIQRKLSTSVWSNCTSWYRNGHTGKVVSQWPGTMTQYWWRLRKQAWGHYKAVNADKWIRQRRGAKLVRGVGCVSLVLALLWAQKNRRVVAGFYFHLVGQLSEKLKDLPSIPWLWDWSRYATTLAYDTVTLA